jgi:hypothetical protein
VVLCVGLGCLVAVVFGMGVVPARHVSVVAGRFVLTTAVVLGCGPVMFCRLLMMSCSVFVMLRNFAHIRIVFLLEDAELRLANTSDWNTHDARKLLVTIEE